MNKEQIIDEVYENYEKWWEPYIAPVDYDRDGIPYYSKEQFINKCKTDPEFSEKWGLRIEERELSLEERLELFKKENNGSHPYDIEMLDDYNIPTKLITLTYNNETLESYE